MWLVFFISCRGFMVKQELAEEPVGDIETLPKSGDPLEQRHFPKTRLFGSWLRWQVQG
jgi:hypothetical protein